MARYVLLDRDGTINVEKHYLHKPEDLEFCPGVVEGLTLLRDRGYRFAVLTNQSGVGRGYYGLDDVQAVHTRLSEMLGAHGIEIDGYYLCPHAPDEDCDCRKPKTGMAEQAKADLGVDFSQAIMIGDKPADVNMGKAIGATTILVRTGHGEKHAQAKDCDPDHIAADLGEAARWIEKRS